MTYSTELPPLIVSLNREAHEKALEFAANQSTPELGKRVYLNTLAVYAVHSFLKWMEIETDLSASDSWNPFLGRILDTADLVLPGLGRLECCPVLPEDSTCTLPWLQTEDLIGYVAVQFSYALDSVKLLGFAPAVDVSEQQEQLPLTNLRPLEALEEYLNRLKDAIAFIEEDDDPVAVRVREVLSTRNSSEIVAQLERVYRTSSRIKWRYAGADILAGSGAGGVADRESTQDSDKTQLQKLAQNLIDKLAKIWGKAE